MKKTLLITVAILLAVSFAVCPVFAAAEDAAAPASVGYSASRIETKDLTEIPCLHLFLEDAYADATEFKISSVDDLKLFGSYINDYFQSFSGVTIYLEHDIDLNGETWSPVGYNANGKSSNYFAGTFDGQGHVIDNFKVEDNSCAAGAALGFFGTVKGATIKNLVIGSRASVSYTGTVGDIRLGGLVGCLLSGVCTVDNCYVLATVSTTTNYGGGIVGTLNGNGSIIKNSTFGGSVTSKQRSGGILSYLGNTSMTIDNCRNTGTVTNSGSGASCYTGGVVGMLNNKVGTCKVTNCINNGEIVGDGSANGGIVGMTRGATTYSGNLNYGTVNNPADLFTTGGIFAAYYEAADADKQVIGTGNQNLAGQTDATLSTVPTVTPSFFTGECDLSDGSTGDDNTTTEPPTTSAPTPTPDAPTTNAPADDKSTSAPTAEVTAGSTDGEQDETSGGCGSVIGGSVAILLAFGMAAVVSKKREY